MGPTTKSCDSAPNICVGMPVYNGAKTLGSVLKNITSQSFRNIEIIISDNGSTDNTPSICKKFAAQDNRIQYFRQARTISPTANFNFVLQKASTPFFMWAAHDDTRDLEFIEKLFNALDTNPKAILAFGDVIEYMDGTGSPLPLDFFNANRTPVQRLYWAATSQLHHLYGLWRTQALRQITWRHVNWWHDTPLMMAAAILGDFLYVPGVEFHYLYNKRPFFDWDRKPGIAGLADSMLRASKRGLDLCYLVWLSATTVNRVAGMRMGIYAGLFTIIKVISQTKTFVANRI